MHFHVDGKPLRSDSPMTVYLERPGSDCSAEGTFPGGGGGRRIRRAADDEALSELVIHLQAKQQARQRGGDGGRGARSGYAAADTVFLLVSSVLDDVQVNSNGVGLALGDGIVDDGPRDWLVSDHPQP
jgi:hypothetical protein